MMLDMTVLAVLASWVLVSGPAAVVVGHYLGRREPTPVPVPVQEAVLSKHPVS